LIPDAATEAKLPIKLGAYDAGLKSVLDILVRPVSADMLSKANLPTALFINTPESE